MKALRFWFRGIPSVLGMVLVWFLFGCNSPATTVPPREAIIPEPEYRDNVTITYTRDTSKIISDSDTSSPLLCVIRAYDPKAARGYLDWREEKFYLYEISKHKFQGTANHLLIQTKHYPKKHKLYLLDKAVYEGTTQDGIEIEGSYEWEVVPGTGYNGITHHSLDFKISKD